MSEKQYRQICEAALAMRSCQKRCSDRRRMTEEMKREMIMREKELDRLLRLYQWEKRQQELFEDE